MTSHIGVVISRGGAGTPKASSCLRVFWKYEASGKLYGLPPLRDVLCPNASVHTTVFSSLRLCEYPTEKVRPRENAHFKRHNSECPSSLSGKYARLRVHAVKGRPGKGWYCEGTKIVANEQEQENERAKNDQTDASGSIQALVMNPPRTS